MKRRNFLKGLLAVGVSTPVVVKAIDNDIGWLDETPEIDIPSLAIKNGSYSWAGRPTLFNDESSGEALFTGDLVSFKEGKVVKTDNNSVVVGIWDGSEVIKVL